MIGPRDAIWSYPIIDLPPAIFVTLEVNYNELDLNNYYLASSYVKKFHPGVTAFSWLLYYVLNPTLLISTLLKNGVLNQWPCTPADFYAFLKDKTGSATVVATDWQHLEEPTNLAHASLAAMEEVGVEELSQYLPQIMETFEQYPSIKMEILLKRVTWKVDQKLKTLIYAPTTFEAKFLQLFLQRKGFVSMLLTGDTPPSERPASVSTFSKCTSTFVMIFSGSLDLLGYNNWHSCGWNLILINRDFNGKRLYSVAILIPLQCNVLLSLLSDFIARACLIHYW